MGRIGSGWMWWRKVWKAGGGDVHAMKGRHSMDVHALHKSISDPSRKTLLFFSARGCRLCAAVRGPATSEAAEVNREQRRGVGVDLLEMDAGGEMWRPEVTQFQVTRVPCFVLIGEDGVARCKTSDAAAASGSKDKIVRALRLLLDNDAHSHSSRARP